MFLSFLTKLSTLLTTNKSGEETFYPILEEMFLDYFNSGNVKGEYQIITTPTNEKDGNRPDFLVLKGCCDVGIVEAKDIGKDLDSDKFVEQFERYKQTYENVLITNFLEWRFYYKQNEIKRVKIGKLVAKTDGFTIQPLPDNFEDFNHLLIEFLLHKMIIINADNLAERMGQQAILLRQEMRNIFTNKTRKSYYKLSADLETIRRNLKKDTTEEDYISLYSQMTIYGIFIARIYYKGTPEGFTIYDISKTIPHSNGFLYELFRLDNDPFWLDDRLKIIISRVVEMMANTDIITILDKFAKKQTTASAIVEFYETFLDKFDRKLRADMGVWYTPQPIVSFIIRQIDLILQNVFNIKGGIIDTTEVAFNEDGSENKNGIGIKSIQPQVQVLDPATGTGTFLVEYIRLAFEKFIKSNRYNEWNSFVEKYLLKNLNAFEVMMCPYVLAHLQIDIILQQFGTNADNFISKYIVDNNIFPDPNDKKYLLEGFIWRKRCGKDNINDIVAQYSGYHISGNYQSHKECNIVLTNSLDDWNDPQEQTQELYGSMIEIEGTKARQIKKHKHIMVVMGNPPYNSSTMNKGKWITSLIDDYKYERNENNEKINLLKDEKNIKPLSDDYVKFIRYGENYIEKNNRGILSFITNNSYLDGCTHRVMRKHLLKTFDDIYIFNLHGDARRDKQLMKENNDQNPFNIMQGVAISIFVKKPHDEEEYEAKKQGKTYTKPLATVHYKDLIGSRYDKFKYLDEHNIFDDNELLIKENLTSYYPDFNNKKQVQFDKEWIPERDSFLFVPKCEEGREEYEKGVRVSEMMEKINSGLKTAQDDVVIQFTKKEIQKVISNFQTLTIQELKNLYKVEDKQFWTFERAKNDIMQDKYFITEINYRAFDQRWTAYTGNSRGFFESPRSIIMNNLVKKKNIALITRKIGNGTFISNKITDAHCISEWDYIFPLYTFSPTDSRHTNFQQSLLKTFSEKLGIPFKESCHDDFAGFNNGIRVEGFWNRYNDKTKFNELHLFDYIYGILNDKEYKEKYKVFLEMDFPRVPYPENIDTFFETARKGEILRHLHLMEIADTSKYTCIDFSNIDLDITLRGDKAGEDKIENVKFEPVENLKIKSIYGEIQACRVWINKFQYFVIPEFLWDYKIGSYRPVTEYLKKRKDRILTTEEQKHFERICRVVVVSENF